MLSNLEKVLQKAFRNRARLLEAQTSSKTNCFRLFNGAREGIAGLTIEQYGDVVIFQVFEEESTLSPSDLKDVAEWVVEQTQAKSVYKKVFVADRSKKVAGKEYYDQVPFIGESSPSAIVVSENGIRFEIQPFSGYSTGLFLDQRNNRQFLAEKGQSKTVLNLFAYTCGFSVACAAAGATTTSVDLSKKYLDWGKRNFELNQLGMEGHQFIAEDCFSFLKKAEKRSLFYDVVIVDPPSFSRTKTGGVFSIKKDLEKLLKLVIPRVAPKGILFVSSNLSDWDSTILRERSLPLIHELGAWKWLTGPGTPDDFLQARHPLSQWMIVRE